MRISLWDARDPETASEWRSRCASWPAREVFADPAYVRLFATERDQPLAAFAETDSGFILYPFVLRPIDAPHLCGQSRPSFDITSAYGYAGAFTSGATDVDAKSFWSSFDEVCRERHVTAEFTRLSLFESERLAPPAPVTQKLTNVVVDLRMPEDQLWREFESKVRRNVNKATRSGVQIEVDEDGRRLTDFVRIYTDTMRRRQAAENYYFPRSFFEAIVRDLPGQFTFFHALHGGRVISTELVLVSGRSLYFYLGGTDEAFFDLRPNELLKFEVMRWGRARGKERYVLGGGYAPDDGIFRYKKAFAPRGLLPYHVASRVLDAERYESLVRAHLAEGRRRDEAWQPDDSFFPTYRRPLPSIGPDGD
ncbi:GNAT family N-acetyltransferase [Micromonospora soli]|uniref:lipid II:glycine glycyltransferase FemX n=1 Tax=Micromonospora sp. NBRC 110009 TaxID=3061627 RepID=UPI0026735850|nr:GNAT family N-acetyltransferase [Micromonospora sp. NBRC 110009]WKT99065.1 GNAT family N-acetyltransferase [Micromonospora sp. NBRC 110009]